MKILKAAIVTLIVLAVLILFGRFFLSQLGSGQTEGPAAVMFTPPPGYTIVERGELSPTAAAAELEARTLQPGGKVGIHFQQQGAEVYWLADTGADQLEELSAGESGTRLQTVWHGNLAARLAWARTHGTFDAPGLPPAERKNLYH